MQSPSRSLAVITGDIVGSTELGTSQLDEAISTLEQMAAVQADWHCAPLHFTRHRGDGWQVVLARPELALRSALAFRAALRAKSADFDSYMGIATGTVEAQVGPDLNAETATVFERSGSALERVKRASLDTRIATAEHNPLEATVCLADHISQGWTSAQSQTILWFLPPGKPPTATHVARHVGKSRQAVSKALDAAGGQPLLYALNCLEGFQDD